MPRFDDAYAYSVDAPLLVPIAGADPDHPPPPLHYGTASLRYEVRAVNDLRNLGFRRLYLVSCVQRITLPNKYDSSEAAKYYPFQYSSTTGYEDYLALLTCNTQLSKVATLVSYFPKTLNSAVNSSTHSDDGKSSTITHQTMQGSSTSETNTFGVNLSGGLQGGPEGPTPTGSIGGDYSHSKTTESSSSTTDGTEAGSNRQTGVDASMSIKDWCAYAFIDAAKSTPSWIWGQEYPWDVVKFGNNEKGNTPQLPTVILDRLFDRDPASSDTKPAYIRANPPSQLSLFGIDVTMKATWIIELPASLADQCLVISHDLQHMRASHHLTYDDTKAINGVAATLGPALSFSSLSSPIIDLTVLGLDPILNAAPTNGAVVGFAPGKFLVDPRDGRFKILSEANNLQVSGAGFKFDAATPGSPMQATNGAELWVEFKVLDATEDYTLFLKHWTGGGGCKIEVFVNDTSGMVVKQGEPVPLGTPPAPSVGVPVLTRYVNAAEGQGAENNLMAIKLRDTDYSSADYHDYLRRGHNLIEVRITPMSSGAKYALRALAIGVE